MKQRHAPSPQHAHPDSDAMRQGLPLSSKLWLLMAWLCFVAYTAWVVGGQYPHAAPISRLARLALWVGTGSFMYVVLGVYLSLLRQALGTGSAGLQLVGRLMAACLVLAYVPWYSVDVLLRSHGAPWAAVGVLVGIALAGSAPTDRLAALRPDTDLARAEMALLVSPNPPRQISDMLGFHAVIVALVLLPLVIAALMG